MPRIGSVPSILGLLPLFALPLFLSCVQSSLPCGPHAKVPDGSVITIAITASQSQLQGWSTQIDPTSWSWTHSCVYRSSDNSYLRAAGPYLAAQPDHPAWSVYTPGPWNGGAPIGPEDYGGPLEPLARRIVEGRNKPVQILSTAVGSTSLAWHIGNGGTRKPEWQPDCVLPPAEDGWCGIEWDRQFVDGLAETGWAIDLAIMHLGEADAAYAQWWGKSTTPAGNSETYDEMYDAVTAVIDEVYALTGARTMVIPFGKRHCWGSWPACTRLPNPWETEIHDAQADAATHHPQGCLGPDPSDLQLENPEPGTNEVHYHDVIGLADAIYAALPGCGL